MIAFSLLSFNVWNRAVQCLSILDVLLSLAMYVRNSEQQMCRPEIVMLSEESGITKPFIDIKNGRHPCIARTFTGEFIPNDISIGNQVRNFIKKTTWINKHFFFLISGVKSIMAKKSAYFSDRSKYGR